MIVDEKFRTFMMQLAARMAVGNFNVHVICEGGAQFEARLVGYDEGYQQVKVEFLSDSLSVEKYVRVPSVGFGGMGGFGGMDDSDDGSSLELRKVPIKELQTVYTNIILK